MKKYMIVIALLMVVAVPLTAQNEGSNFTNGFPGVGNGRFWKGLTTYEKLVWISGFYIGAVSMSAQDGCDKKPSKMLPQLTFGEVRDSVDRFYSEPENNLIIIPEAIHYVKLKTGNSSGLWAGQIPESELAYVG